MNAPTRREAYAKERAGYAPEDTPCKPSRSAYTDDSIGTGAYGRACQRWELFVMLLNATYWPNES